MTSSFRLLICAFLFFSGASAAFAENPRQSMNPDISVILDGYAYYDHFQGTDEDLGHLYEEIAGFGHTHGEEGHAHAVEPADGLNWRHAELNFSGNVDPFFKAWAIVGVSPEGAELEVAQVETLSLPAGLKVKAGKFFSDFGRINPQHAHQWDFITPPLVTRLLFGGHGLNDIGLQAAWLTPASFFLEIGVEGFDQGGGHGSFTYLGETNLPRIKAPRVGVAWIKAGPDLPEPHALLAGLTFIQGVRQEAHDGDEDGAADHWLSGWARVLGLDLTYKYDDPAAYGQGDWVFQAEYYLRDIRMQVYGHDLNPDVVGNDLIQRQDGLYAQVVYGFASHWRVGARYDRLGFFNRAEYPDGGVAGFQPTTRASAMVDCFFTEFSRLRLEAAYGEYALASDEKASGWSGGLQIDVSLGTHGAHAF